MRKVWGIAAASGVHPEGRRGGRQNSEINKCLLARRTVILIIRMTSQVADRLSKEALRGGSDHTAKTDESFRIWRLTD